MGFPSFLTKMVVFVAAVLLVAIFQFGPEDSPSPAITMLAQHEDEAMAVQYLAEAVSLDEEDTVNYGTDIEVYFL